MDIYENTLHDYTFFGNPSNDPEAKTITVRVYDSTYTEAMSTLYRYHRLHPDYRWIINITERIINGSH